MGGSNSYGGWLNSKLASSDLLHLTERSRSHRRAMADVLEREYDLWRIEHPNVAWEPVSPSEILDGGRLYESPQTAEDFEPTSIEWLNRPPSNKISTDRLHPGHNGLGIKLLVCAIYDTVPELPAQSCESAQRHGLSYSTAIPAPPPPPQSLPLPKVSEVIRRTLPSIFGQGGKRVQVRDFYLGSFPFNPSKGHQKTSHGLERPFEGRKLTSGFG